MSGYEPEEASGDFDQFEQFRQHDARHQQRSLRKILAHGVTTFIGRFDMLVSFVIADCSLVNGSMNIDLPA